MLPQLHMGKYKLSKSNSKNLPETLPLFSYSSEVNALLSFSVCLFDELYFSFQIVYLLLMHSNLWHFRSCYVFTQESSTHSFAGPVDSCFWIQVVTKFI